MELLFFGAVRLRIHHCCFVQVFVTYIQEVCQNQADANTFCLLIASDFAVGMILFLFLVCQHETANDIVVDTIVVVIK